jgi:hypothetical protein
MSALDQRRRSGVVVAPGRRDSPCLGGRVSMRARMGVRRRSACSFLALAYPGSRRRLVEPCSGPTGVLRAGHPVPARTRPNGTCGQTLQEHLPGSLPPSLPFLDIRERGGNVACPLAVRRRRCALLSGAPAGRTRPKSIAWKWSREHSTVRRSVADGCDGARPPSTHAGSPTAYAGRACRERCTDRERAQAADRTVHHVPARRVR